MGSVTHSREMRMTEVRCVWPTMAEVLAGTPSGRTQSDLYSLVLNESGYTEGVSLLTGGACHSWLLFHFFLTTSSREQLIRAIRGRSTENLLTETRLSHLPTKKKKMEKEKKMVDL